MRTMPSDAASAYDHWLTNDYDGGRCEAEAEARAETITDAWSALGYHDRAELLLDADYRFRTNAPWRNRKIFIREFIGEKLG